jgi:hypothetical protein
VSVPSFVAKRVLIPRKEDLVLGIVLSLVISFLLRIEAIYILPIATALVILVFAVRRVWKMLTLYFFYRSMRKKADNGIEQVKDVFGLK